MIKDVFVNGTSVATGVGLGKSKLGSTDLPDAWPFQFCNKVNAGNLWNHSIPSKPFELSIRDTYGFVNQYLDDGGKAEDLFVLNEFLSVGFPPLLQPVFESENTIVFPVIYSTNSLKISVEQVSKDFRTYFCETQKNPDYLQGPIYKDSVDTISEHLRFKHEHDKNNYYRYQHTLSGRLHTVVEEICKLQLWLSAKNIKYLSFWATGGTHLHNHNREYANMVDKASRKNYNGNFIPMNTFGCLDYGVYKSLSSRVGTHPDAVGQYAIAEFLYNYLHNENIL